MKIEIEGDSDAAVALALLRMIMQAEEKEEEGADREYILSTYSQCLAVVTDGVFIGVEDDKDEDEQRPEAEQPKG